MRQMKKCLFAGIFCLLWTFSVHAGPLGPVAVNSGGQPACAPTVTPQMCGADYWIARYPAADSVLLSPEGIQQVNRKIRETQETKVLDLAAVEETFNGRAMVDSMTSEAYPAGLFLNGQPAPESYFEGIWANIRGAAVSENMNLRYGFAVNRTLLRAYPGSDILSDSADDPEWDAWATSAVSVNEPLILYFFSGDGRYAYVRSAVCPGWIPAEDIAVCGSKAQWADARSMSKFLVVTGDRIYLEESLLHPQASEKMLTMGTVLELADIASDTEVDGRLSWNNYVVKLPHRNSDGSFSQTLALVPASRDVSVGYLPLTVSGILNQAFKCLGDRYGWGGSMNAWDCSSYIRDVYRCFGLEIPRNTSWQAAMPVQTTAMEAMSVPEKEAVLRALTPGAIVQCPGHEMIYLGEENGQFYVINAASSTVRLTGVSDEMEKLRLRTVIVSSLSLLRGNGHRQLEDLSRTITAWK